jgi:hypothetical protein
MAFWFVLTIGSFLFIWLITDAVDIITNTVLVLLGIGAATALGATIIDANKKAPVPGAGNIVPRPSQGFWTDIMSDVNGVEFHRFQMVIWTVILGLVFLVSVWSRLSMPEFNATLLTLMGISSGTYLGFKIPER